MTANVMTAPTCPVICAGDPTTMGVAQGESLAVQIQGCYEALRDIEAFRLEQPGWLPFSWFRRLAARRARHSVSPAIASDSPKTHERLLGIARGSGMRNDSLWLLQAMEGLLASVRENSEIPPPGGCSALSIRGRMSAIGEPVIAHNFDYLPVVQPYYAIRESRPTGGYRSIEFTAAPLAGALDGVNEKGLAVTYDYGQTVDEGTPGPMISMRISELLARCETVAEALNYMTERPRWGSGLLMFADRHGDIASLELSNTRVGVRVPGDGLDCLFHSNKFQCDSTIAVEVPVEAVFNSRAPRTLRKQRVLDSSLRRDARFTELLSDVQSLDLEQLGSIMADHGADCQPSDGTICMHSDYWVTTACIQCLPRSRALRVSYGTACQARFVEFAL